MHACWHQSHRPTAQAIADISCRVSALQREPHAIRPGRPGTVYHMYITTNIVINRVLQVLAVARSRSTTWRSSSRRVTDSDTHPLTAAHDDQSIPTAPDQQAMALVKSHEGQNVQSKLQASNEAGHMGTAKVQRSLTWTKGSDSHSTGLNLGLPDQASTPAQTLQQHPQQHEQQQKQRQLTVRAQSNMISQDATSSQSSPNVQLSSHGAATHRQRLAGSVAAGFDESGSGSSGSGTMLVPARFQAGIASCL